MSELIYAAKYGYYQQVLSLIESGVCVNVRDKDEATPLYYSACGGNSDICKTLLENGSDVNSKVKWGSTSLHASADRGHTRCVQILLQFGANPNIQNSRGESPLHLCAYRGYLEIVNIFISIRSNPFLKNKGRKTPAQEAESQNQRLIAYKLYEYMNMIQMGTLTDIPNSANALGNKRYMFVKSFSDTNMLSNSTNNHTPDSKREENGLDRVELNDLNRSRDLHQTENNATGFHRKLCRTDSRPNSFGGREGNYGDLLTEVNNLGRNVFEKSEAKRDENFIPWDHVMESSGKKCNPVEAYAEAMQLTIMQLRQENEKLKNDYTSQTEDLTKCQRTLKNYQSLLVRYSKDREHLKKTIQKSNSLENATKLNRRIDGYSPAVLTARGPQRELWKIIHTHSRLLKFLRTSSDCAQTDARFSENLRESLTQAFPFWETEHVVSTSKKEWVPLVDYVFREKQPLNQRHDGGRDGSCSLVFKISCEGKPYILKMMINLLNLDFTKHGDGNSLTGFLSSNFGSEYQIPLKLSSHPGILKIHHFFEGSLEHFRDYKSLLVPQNLDVPIELANRSTFLIMKEYPKSLMNFIVDQRNRHKEAPYGLSEDFILHLFYQLLSTICFLQENGVVHRDIKADNVFLDWRLRPVLADFGFARKLYNVDGSDIPWTATNDIYAGNTHAWAPELVRSSRTEPDSLPKDLSLRKIYERSDAFAVARMFYNLLCPLDDDCYFPRSSANRPHYADEEIPSLPSCYSAEMGCVMKKLVLSDPSPRMTAEEAMLRIGMMLFGPKPGELKDKNDARIYKHARMMSLLSVEIQETEPSDPSFHISIEDSVQINSSWLEANFLSEITEDEIWKFYTEKVVFPPSDTLE